MAKYNKKEYLLICLIIMLPGMLLANKRCWQKKSPTYTLAFSFYPKKKASKKKSYTKLQWTGAL
jgi:hypothetical protein